MGPQIGGVHGVGDRRGGKRTAAAYLPHRVLLAHRPHGHVEPDELGEVAGPGAGGVDHRTGAQQAVLGLDPGDAIALADQPAAGGAESHLATGGGERLDEGLRGLHRVGIAAAGLVDDHADAVGIQPWVLAGEILGIDHRRLDAERAVHRHFLPGGLHPVRRDELGEPGVLEPPVLTQLVRETVEERDRVLGDARHHRDGVERAHDRGALAGVGARGPGARLQQQNLAHALLLQPVRGARAADAGADDDDVEVGSHFLALPPRPNPPYPRSSCGKRRRAA